MLNMVSNFLKEGREGFLRSSIDNIQVLMPDIQVLMPETVKDLPPSFSRL